MGIKSTTELTLEDAVERVIDLKLAEVRRLVEIDVREMSETELEEYLEYASDRDAGGEGFDNFKIVDKPYAGMSF